MHCSCIFQGSAATNYG